MINFIIAIFLFNPAHANNVKDIIGKVKKDICNCKNDKEKREIDIELFHEPIIVEPYFIFDRLPITPLKEVKIIFRYRF